ncbi:MAG: carbonic anhydrase [Candidatus Kerfeldbacteria bacterium]
MKHTCSTLVIHCMDFRFVAPTRSFLESLGLANDYDDVSVAGAGKNLADPTGGNDAEFVLHQLATSKKLHGITQIIIVNHLDCGAYGGAKSFANADEERNRHVGDLEIAKDVIINQLGDISVTKVLARIDDEGKVDFEKIV